MEEFGAFTKRRGNKTRRKGKFIRDEPNNEINTLLLGGGSNNPLIMEVTAINNQINKGMEMASHKFYNVYMKELEKKRFRFKDIWEKWDRKDETIPKIEKVQLKLLKELVEIIISAKNDYSKRQINTFEYNFIKYNFIYLFAKHCGNLHDEYPIFVDGLKRFQKEGIIKEEEKADIIEMSPLSRWGVF